MIHANRIGGGVPGRPECPVGDGRSLIIVEAVRFDDPGGWTIDTSCMESTRTPFLMAHGIGIPVADATTSVRLPTAGRWRVWVRTYDWVARWGSPGKPGRFAVLVDGLPLTPEFGVTGETWGWQDGGVVEIDGSVVQVTLRDLTGFNGRCQAVCFSRDTEDVPPPDDACLWRRPGMGSGAELEQPRRYDLVVVGGGYAGMCTALMAARSGLAVALVQDRGVLGGNASSEIRVPLRGLPLAGGRLPWLGCCVAELQYDAAPDARQPDEHTDARHLAVMKAERRIELLLGHVLYDVTTEAGCIRTIRVRDVRRGRDRIIAGRCFADCTGHGTLGALAGAEYVIGMGGDPATDHDHPLMGMTNLWSWEMGDTPVPAPEMPWALDMTLDDFPSTHLRNAWSWESGFHRHPIDDLERIRDNNLRAIFGAWRAMKRRADDGYTNARLTRVAAIGGPRESRRLIGDLILNEDDMLKRVDFPDGFVPASWFLDRHIPTPESRRLAPDDPFLSLAIHKPGTERNARPRHEAPWYGIPYRCLYSRNIGNLFMAGRNISTSYWALGATRVMRTCGMMGEVVGRAAAICVRHNCLPRDVFLRYLSEIKQAPEKSEVHA